MIILAIDASLNCPGFAVVEIEDSKPSVLRTLVVDNSEDAKKPSGRRKTTARKILEICRAFHYLIDTYHPDVLVREKGFSRYPNTTQLLFRVVGALDLTAMDFIRKEIIEIPPKEVKLTMTGSGTADKLLVATALPYYVGDRPYMKDDESDAVALALTYAIKFGLIESKLVTKTRRKIGRPKKGARRQMVMPSQNMKNKVFSGSIRKVNTSVKNEYKCRKSEYCVRKVR